jgi:hypothetical protein
MMRKCPFWRWLALAVMMLTGFTGRILAWPNIPANVSFVTVQPTDPLATEPDGNSGNFTLSRTGDTNASLTIPFSIGGTASNGVDYAVVPLTVTFAAGQTSTNIAVAPVNEPSATGYKTVVLSLPRHSTNFFVGSLDRAVVYIVYDYTNVPPSVRIVTPTNAASFLSLPNIELAANTSDSNDWVTAVEFLANGAEIGMVTNNPFHDDPFRPLVLRESHGSVVPILPGSRLRRFQFVWTNVPPASYSLTAVATDNAGLQTTSDAITIEVTTNLPVPRVRIINPVHGAEFPDRAAINLFAAAGEAGGVVNTVEFLANGASVGMVTNYLAAEPDSPFHLRLQWLPYFLRWTNAPVGSNILTAVVTDNNGSTVTSAPVHITVTTNLYHHRYGWGR